MERNKVGPRLDKINPPQDNQNRPQEKQPQKTDSAAPIDISAPKNCRSLDNKVDMTGQILAIMNKSQWAEYAHFPESRFKTGFFNGILVDDEEERSLALNNIAHILRTWTLRLNQIQTDKPACLSQENDSNNVGRNSAEDLLCEKSPSEVDRTDSDPKEIRNLLNFHLLTVLRHSITCPYRDVREKFHSLIEELKALGIKIPQPFLKSPSFFIQFDKIVSLDTHNAELSQLMKTCFLGTGRFSNVFRLLAYFPEFLQKYLHTFNQVMRMQGPLPRTWRSYLAIMAASQHKCQYLVSLQTREFLQNGGDVEWLNGLSSAPSKLQSIAKINSILAHQPWLIKKEHIQSITKGIDNWSMSELVQGIVVLTTFHGLSSFVLGCGVAHEIDMPGGIIDDLDLIPKFDGLDTRPEDETELHTNQLLDRLKLRQPIDDGIEAQRDVFETLESKETFSLDKHHSPNPLSDSSTLDSSMNFVLEDLARFLTAEEITYSDFDVRSTDYAIFRLQEYNWEEHGCSLIVKYLPDTGEMLEQEFSCILNLTDYTIFNVEKDSSQESVDTWPFRQAIWYYVFRLCGMCHDDYNYHDVNIYLNKRIKQYVKKVACNPEKITPFDFHNIGFSFRPDEKIHINLLASEAWRCASLLYALRLL